MARITVILSDDERIALIQLAEIELRHPTDEARFLLRQGLIQNGVLKTNTTESIDVSTAANVPATGHSSSQVSEGGQETHD